MRRLKIKAFVTIEVGADKKLNRSQLLHAIRLTLEMSESMSRFLGHPLIEDYSSNYVRIPIGGIRWKDE